MRGRLSELALGDLELSPAFDPNVFRYTPVSFTAGETYELTAVTDYPGATISVHAINCTYNSVAGTVKMQRTKQTPNYSEVQITVTYHDPVTRSEATNAYEIHWTYE